MYVHVKSIVDSKSVIEKLTIDKINTCSHDVCSFNK